jgi:hypothetical protein
MQFGGIPITQSLKDFEKCKSSMDFNVIIEHMDWFVVQKFGGVNVWGTCSKFLGKS